MSTEGDAEEIRQLVRETYAKLAVGAQTSCCGPAQKVTEAAACCSEPAPAISRRTEHLQKIYSEEELETLPDTVIGAAAGCGNPTAIANLKPGEVVLDLGSGGGIDCFLASQKVGPSGKVIGVDMTPEMVHLARANAAKVGASNVDFRLGELEHLPLRDSLVDVVISNCVINLAPNKDAVFAEMFRVLKPDGRVAVSDIVFESEPSEQIRGSLAAWAGCVSGALLESEYLDKIRAAGFTGVAIDSRSSIDMPGLNISSVKVVATKSGKA